VAGQKKGTDQLSRNPSEVLYSFSENLLSSKTPSACGKKGGRERSQLDFKSPRAAHRSYRGRGLKQKKKRPRGSKFLGHRWEREQEREEYLLGGKVPDLHRVYLGAKGGKLRKKPAYLWKSEGRIHYSSC